MGPVAQLTLFVDAYWCSPFDFSCFVGLREKGLDFSVSRALVREGQAMPAEFRQRALLARVPALAHGDFWLSESMAVLEYLEEAFPPPHHPALYPAGLQQRARVRQVMSFTRSELLQLINERGGWRIVYPGQPTSPLSAKARREADELLDLATRIVSAGELLDFSPGRWDLTYALLRLQRTGEELPPRLADYVAATLERPSVREFLDHPRPPNPPPER
jgi:glutathione S-transferase